MAISRVSWISTWGRYKWPLLHTPPSHTPSANAPKCKHILELIPIVAHAPQLYKNKPFRPLYFRGSHISPHPTPSWWATGTALCISAFSSSWCDAWPKGKNRSRPLWPSFYPYSTPMASLSLLHRQTQCIMRLSRLWLFDFFFLTAKTWMFNHGTHICFNDDVLTD